MNTFTRRVAQVRRILSDYGLIKGSRLVVKKIRAARRHNPTPVLLEGRYLTRYWKMLSDKNSFYAQDPAIAARVLIVADLNIPQCKKYRVEGLVELLNKNSIPTEYSYYQDIPRIMSFIATCSHVVFYRVPICQEFLDVLYECKRSGIQTIYDIDDPVFSVDSYLNYGNTKYLTSEETNHFVGMCPSYFAAMQCCDTISVSTIKLKALAKMYFSQPILVRKNMLQAMDFDFGVSWRRPKNQNDFVMTFATGSRGREDDFALVVPILDRFVSNHPRVKLQIIGDFDINHLPERLKAVTSTTPKLAYTEYLAKLGAADVALLPLAKSQFNEAKSAVRYLDCCLVKTPVIASPVGDYPEVLVDGETGFLAETEDQWYKKLEMLYKQPGDGGKVAEKAYQWQYHISNSSQQGVSGHYGNDLIQLLHKKAAQP